MRIRAILYLSVAILLVCGAPGYAQITGPVASYSFDEGAGTTTADSSGNKNTGTLTTGVAWTTGVTGSAVSFNGTSGNITVNDSVSLDLNGSFTLSAWIKPATLAGIQTILIKEGTGGCGYWLQTAGSQIDSGFNNGSGCIEHSTTTANLPIGVWSHIASVLDHSTNTMKFYLNGSLVLSVSETHVPAPNTQPLVFGMSACTVCKNERWNGAIDTVNIYNRALAASDIQALYVAGSSSGVASAPAITSTNSTAFKVGSAGTFTVTTTGTPKPTLSQSGSLPTGVTFAPATGVLSGKPASGTAQGYPITFTAQNGVTPNATQAFTLTVNQVPAITSTNKTTFTAGTAGTFTVTATGFPAPTFSETGALPSGVSFTSAGVLSGIPAAGTSGSYSITITAQNGVTPNATQRFTLTVNQAPSITSANGATFTVGSAGTFTVTATGSPKPTLSVSGALPAGVTFTASTGVIKGTPGAGTAASYPITITAQNAVAPNAVQSFTLTVNPQPAAPAITSPTAANGTVGSPFTYQITATNTPTSYAATGLPLGLTINSGTGLISGTPMAGGTASVSLSASNSIGTGKETLTLTISVVPPSANVSPSGLTFASQMTGTTSIAQTATLTNTGTSNISGISIATLGDFNQTNNCSTTLAVGASCVISVQFSPSVGGTRSGNVTVTDNAGNSPQVLTLTGTGFALASINVSPLNRSIAPGTKQQFLATGVFSDGSTQDLTNSVTWGSSNLIVGTISGSGLASSASSGATSISAASGVISGSANLNVTSATLVSISVIPPSPSMPIGIKQQFTAMGTFSDNTTQDITSSVNWSSLNGSVASVTNAGVVTSLASGGTTIQATSGQATGSANLTVTTVTLSSTGVTSGSLSMAASTMQQFTATGTFSDGSTLNLTNSVTWTSSLPSVATISSSGLVSTLTSGSATISAASGLVSGSTILPVTSAKLTSIAVTPAIPPVALGMTQAFAATGTFSDGTSQDVTSTAHWTSSASNVATVGTSIGSAGLAQTLAVGPTTISATVGAITASTTMTVTPAILTSIQVTPPNATIPLGTTQQLAATGIFTDGTTHDLTATATWSSSVGSIASISNVGLATSLAVGPTVISATSGAISGSTGLNVAGAKLASIVVAPPNPSVPLGETQQFTATGTYTDASTQDITTSVQWTSGSATVATISNSVANPGLAKGVGVGPTSIGAASGSVSGLTQLTVSPAVLTAIALTPANPSIALGTTQQFVATATFSDGTIHDVSATVTWGSSDNTVAIVNSSGLATSSGPGNVTIGATSGSVASSTSLTVTTAKPVSITVTPPSPSITLGSTQQFTAIGTFDDGSTQNLTSVVTWTSSPLGIVTISNGGLATSATAGNPTITATFGAVSGSASLIVNPPALVSIAVAPPSPSITLGLTQQFTATGTYSNGSTQDLTSTVTWQSSASGVASINTSGLATTAGQGNTMITATSGPVIGSATVTVTPAALVSIAVAPVGPSIALGLTQQFSATGTYTDGSVQSLTTVTWQSSASGVATINSTGLATSVSQGNTTISAAVGSLKGSTLLTVNQPSLVSIAVTPVSPSITLGLTQQFAATGTYSNGSTQNLTSTVTWQSSAAGVATISPAGLAASVGLGSTMITVTSGTFVGTASLAVVPVPALISISVTPVAPSIVLGLTQQFAATGTLSDGSTQNLTNAVTWTSSATSVATIGATGLAATVGLGNSTITAAAGPITGTAVLNVLVPPKPVLVHSKSLSALINTTGGNGFRIQYGGSMGKGSLASNLVVLTMTYPHGSTVSSIVDNQSSAYILGASTDSGSGGWVTAMYYVPGAAAGITQITVNFSAPVNDWHGAVREFSAVNTISPVDGSCTNNAATPATVQCSSPLTTTVSGDLIISSAMLVGGLGSNLCGNTSSSIAPGGSFVLDSADPFCSDAEEEFVQPAAGAVTPSFSIAGNSGRFNIVAMAFKAASAGTAPTGMYILHQQTVFIDEQSSSQPNYFVSSGNLLVAAAETNNFNGGTGDVISIGSCSPANTWTKRVSNLNPDSPQIFFVPSANTSTNMRCTVSQQNPGSTTLLVIYDVVGAASSPEDVDSPGYEGQQGGAGVTITGAPTLTPSSAPGIAFAAMNTGMGPSSGAAPGYNYDNTPFTGETDQSGLNNGDGWQHVFYTGTSPLSFNWLMANPVDSYSYAFAVSFKSATPAP